MKIAVFFVIIVVLILVGCHSKQKTNTIGDSSVFEIDMDSINKDDTMPKNDFRFISLIKPLPTRTELSRVENGNKIEIKGNDIQINFLLGKSDLETGGLRTEIFNYTDDDIFYVKSWFDFYDGKKWVLLPVPEGFSILDIGVYIPKSEKSAFFFFIPPIHDSGKSKYRLVLNFTNSDRTHSYDVIKEFMIVD